MEKTLEQEYEKVVSRAVKLKLIKRKEWDNRFINYRDEYGHSFVHYLECIMHKIEIFVTLNPIMFKHREELQKRFGVRIASIEELDEELKTKCPYCGHITTEHETLDGRKNPTDKDINFCINCGEISQYEDDKLVKIDINSLDESIKQEINDIRIAWLRTKAISKTQKGEDEKN